MQLRNSSLALIRQDEESADTNFPYRARMKECLAVLFQLSRCVGKPKTTNNRVGKL